MNRKTIQPYRSQILLAMAVAVGLMLLQVPDWKARLTAKWQVSTQKIWEKSTEAGERLSPEALISPFFSVIQ
jgi:hypothetical protein